MDRIDDMWQMRQSGATLARIGDAYGISRQRVHQLLRRGRSTAIIGLLASSQLTELAGCPYSYIRKLQRRGIIQTVRVPGRKRWLWPADSPGRVISYQQSHPELCQICGRPLPRHRSVYCSDACYAEAKRRQRQARRLASKGG